MAAKSRIRFLLNTAATLTAVSLFPSLAVAGDVLPTGGTYAAGQGTIAAAGATLTVQQSSTTGIISWSSFSVGEGAAVRFENGGGATLNRVTGGDLSRIGGSLSASGSLYLINPKGVVVTGDGKVVTGGAFVASSRTISDAAFLAGGDLEFTGAAAQRVINAGSIVAGGDAVLIGSGVINTGSIQAGGLAGLAAGDDVLLSRIGDQHLFIKAGVGDVSTGGVVSAATAELRAASGNVYALAGNAGGLVSATGTRTVGGHVWLTSESGSLMVSGAVTAAGAPGSLGFIQTSGHVVSVGGARIDAGQGGQWLVDPDDLTVDAATAAAINTSLGAGTNVSLQTTDTGAAGPGLPDAGGNGDILIKSALSWNSSAVLSLSAWRNIDINANIALGGGGKLALITNTGGGGGAYSIAPGSSVSFNGGRAAGAAFTVNGASYKILYSMADIQAINASAKTLKLNYALATSIDASTDPTLPKTWLPIGLTALYGVTAKLGFSGVFAGLGNTIQNFNLDIGSHSYAGLFGVSTGTLRDIGMVGGAVNGAMDVGELVGLNKGLVLRAYSTGAVGGTVSEDKVGSANVGGLVGLNGGTVSESYATGNATGRASVGGLVGYNLAGGSVLRSFATGAVKAAHYGGGLVGWNLGAITDVFATGSVYATDKSSMGGLVAMNRGNGSITSGYSTGAIIELYTTSLHNGPSSQERGYVGSTFDNATVQYGYWDVETSGRANQGKTTYGASPGVMGLTTLRLQEGLPRGLSSTVWGAASGRFPHFLWMGN